MSEISPAQLSDVEYDSAGWPIGRLLLTWHSYALTLGEKSCWVAEYDDLIGYYGEGATISDALAELKQDLGQRPHYRSTARRRTPARLKLAIRQKFNARAAAASTRVDGWGKNLGGGDSVDVTAKAYGVGKTAINRARGDLQKAISSPKGQRVVGFSKDSLKEVIRVAAEMMELELLVARETPWRLEHAEARKKFQT